MTGHVFHPGHDEWHGQTVVVFTSGRQTVVGRWHDLAGGRVNLHDVAVHEEGTGGEGRDAWLARLKQYGIPVMHRDFALPSDAVTKVVRLRDA